MARQDNGVGKDGGTGPGAIASPNTVWHPHAVTRAMRAQRARQRPVVIWFTGLSGAGKSTIANALEAWLYDHGHSSYLLDGDNVRQGLNRDLGFSDRDREENIRRIGEVAKLFADAGMIALTAFISPFRRDRELVRALLPEGEFIEIHVATSLTVCESRDPKGLYRKARQGQIPNFTGIDSPYEAPLAPEIVIDTAELAVEDAVLQIVAVLRERGILE